MDRWYPKAIEALPKGDLDLEAGTVKAALIDTGAYTYSDAHEFWSDAVAGVIGTPVTLGSKTFTGGVFDAADATVNSVPGGQDAGAIIIFIDTGNPATSRLAGYLDGRQRVEVAVAASSGGTAVTVEDLPAAIANGAALTKISGTGPTTITLSALAASGARALTVAALGSNLDAGAVYEFPISGSGLPVTPNGGNITLNWNAAGILSLAG